MAQYLCLIFVKSLWLKELFCILQYNYESKVSKELVACTLQGPLVKL